uniref:GDT1 family protein n=1 Tax=Alexandrium monilatum TaxID=311494 RepID=A0A7S4R5H9_9DINO|mmetsp:Transcript_30913/g.91888  ORF Transcript_30913/g.91888 Transcript_30913/m.91888 type:complete len:249 (-) Transcript_30913:7-753(-)
MYSSHPVLGSPDFNAFLLSVGMVGMAEIFDKTWFVALVMAMRYEKNTVFWGCFAALLVHVFVAAAFGFSVSRLVAPRTLDFLAAGLYGTFAVLYAYDWLTTEQDSDLMAAGKEEVNSSVRNEDEQDEEATYGATKGSHAVEKPSVLGRVFVQCFMAVFIAEWGDRTQIAMIGIHASQPLVPVMLGSTLAFALLTLSAVLVGIFLGDRTLNESTVKAVCAVSFLFFMAMSVRDGLHARAGTQTTPQLPH